MKKKMLLLAALIGFSSLSEAAVAYDGTARKIAETSTTIYFACDYSRDFCCIIWDDGTGSINWPAGVQEVPNLTYDELEGTFTATL